MNSIFKESTLKIIGKIKKGFLWAAVSILIGGFALAAIVLLMGIANVTMTKVFCTMAILVVMLFVGVNNFIRIEKGTKAIQILALVGLIAGILTAIMGILLTWEVFPAYELTVGKACDYSVYGSDCYFMGASADYGPSIAMKIFTILASLAGGGFWLSNVMSIKETVKVVKPLKITSIVCEVYCTLYSIIFVCFLSVQTIMKNSEVFTKMSALSGLAAFAFVVTALAALIISKTAGKKNVESASNESKVKTDAELRAEIEEKVRREMIEKEVREKMGATNTEPSQDWQHDNNDSQGPSLDSDGQS